MVFYNLNTYVPGDMYYFLTLIPPFDIVINKGVITERILDEISDCTEFPVGNIFPTYDDAAKMAKTLRDLFENPK